MVAGKRAILLAERLHPKMKVLVDYDNLPLDVADKGLVYLADRILGRVSSIAGPKQAVDFRLYGGWDRNNRMTRIGQDLSVEILASKSTTRP
jgi:hypothetical protein